MNSMEEVMRAHDFAYMGAGKHKIALQALLGMEDATVLDVRAPEERERLSIDLSIFGVKMVRIPLHELPDRLDEVPLHGRVGIICSAGTRSTLAYAYLLSQGRTNVRIVLGGYDEVVPALMPGKILAALSAQKGA